MSGSLRYLGILLVVVLCQQVCIGVEEPVEGAEPEIDKQLKINRDVLLHGSSEQMRIDAATVILFSSDLQARGILLDVLRQSENGPARQAVCRALIQGRQERDAITNRGDFVRPLLGMFGGENSDEARLAAEAALIFDYKKIAGPLEELVMDSSLPVQVRLNGIYALKLQPDKGAIFKLMDLLDDSNEQVATEAKQALVVLGMPVSEKPAIRRQIREELKRKDKKEFLRDWKIRQQHEMHVLELEKKISFWRNRYLETLDTMYGAIGDDAAKGNFLASRLQDEQAEVRLWALAKVDKLRVGTSKLPDELGPILVGLVSDPARDVRLAAARLLSWIGKLNSAEKLLEQHEVEEDDEVRMELFVALGVACHYAFSPNSGINIPRELKKQTLELACKYLADHDAGKAQSGAEVIRRLLEQNELKSKEIDRYLGLLAARYQQVDSDSEVGLRVGLLGTMSGLCAESAYKDKSAKRFGAFFEKALDDKSDLVREAAIDGLIYVGKSKALNRLRRDFVNDKSEIVRRKVIDLAGEAGGGEDLDWLAAEITSTDGSLAWQAMLKIFERSKTGVLQKWLNNFESASVEAKLSGEQWLSFLETAGRRAESEKDVKFLKSVRGKLVVIYIESGKFEQAAEYLGWLGSVASTDEEKVAIFERLLAVYLQWPNIELAVPLIANRLSERDFEPNDVIVRSIDDYLGLAGSEAEANSLLSALSGIEAGERPYWQQQLSRWQKRFGVATESANGSKD